VSSSGDGKRGELHLDDAEDILPLRAKSGICPEAGGV